jgi:flagellar motility protein MotE (MotC chaperone)
LLPAVFVVGAGLLAMKGIDLARAAQASAAAFDAPDNSGLAPSDTGSAKPRSDFVADESAAASSAEVDVLTSLTRRRSELDTRERALNMRENVLVAGESRVDQKIASLKTLQIQIQDLLGQRDAAQDKQIASLVKTYSSMKPKDAARIFDTLADEVLLPVAKGMKSDVLAPVMAAMNSEAAQRLTVKLAALLKLPQTPPAADCPSAATPTPASSIDATPSLPTTTAAVAPSTAAPLQTAALIPPVTSLPIATAQQASLPVVAPPPIQTAVAPKPHKPAPRKPPVKPATATPPAPSASASATPMPAIPSPTSLAPAAAAPQPAIPSPAPPVKL